VFDQANSGTVFLDEVTEIKFELQAKLLRVIEDHHVTRLVTGRAKEETGFRSTSGSLPPRTVHLMTL
jgi:transcriptional regulator with PAS, ATPase and Fis domain